MKRTVLALLCGLIFLPGSTWAFSFLSIKSAQMWKIHANTYRLKIDINFGGHIDAPPIPDGVTSVTSPELYFTRFSIATPRSARNFYYDPGDGVISCNPDQYAADWSSVGWGHTPGTMGTTFGFDFEDIGPPDRLPHFTFAAELQWCRVAFYEPYAVGSDWLGQDNHRGGIIADVVPEPTTLALFGFGLACASLFRRRR